ncbi:hypothetical protein NDU88_001247 [Pleurodeles waltl]|uniref:Uncharacterized protein n=1 Tax=Pleurodeles waltl TaxID=8319 RepID=A0AAV7Q5D5_PLEWA|nr:hypothetical protein NDU88_001245 [Pleurodeles waltl]KAJ1134801.1 hypothetical protein NDU88_001247 [Pleurodeles waltl]
MNAVMCNDVNAASKVVTLTWSTLPGVQNNGDDRNQPNPPPLAGVPSLVHHFASLGKMAHERKLSSTRKSSPHEMIEPRGLRQRQPDKGGSELHKAEHSEVEADPNIETDFKDLSQEEWKELLTSYSSEKEKECSTAHQQPRSLKPWRIPP